MGGDRAGPSVVAGDLATAAPSAAAAIARAPAPHPELAALAPPMLGDRSGGVAGGDPIARALGAGPGFDLARIPAGTMPLPLDVAGHAPLARELSRAPIDPQLRPAIGEVDDHLEREADRVALTALRIPGAPADDGRAANAPPARALDDLDAAPIDDAELTRGGRPLPARLRGFFEHRLGVDLGAVRIHEGDDAAALTRDVAARALTYGSHVWLGRDEPVAPTFTLAHELTHVIQQTQPRATRPSEISRAPAVIQRRAPYWAPATGKGRVAHGHDAVVKALGANIFTEVPVPLATSSASGVSSSKSVGWADLYVGNNAGPVGISFFDDQGTVKPFAIDHSKGPRKTTLKNKAPFGVGRDGAPRWNGSRVVAVDKAPTKLGVGDVKPLPWADSYLGNVTKGRVKPSLADQLQRYREGFVLAATHVNEQVKAGKATTTTPWSLTMQDTRVLRANEVSIPSTLDLATPVAATERLHLWEGSRRLSTQPANPVRGDQRVFTKPDHDGTWHYAWIPESRSLAAAARAQPTIERLARDIHDQLQRAIEAPPAVTKGPRTPKPRALHRVRRDTARRVRRRTPPVADTFDLAEWKRKQATFRQAQPGVEKTPAWKDAKAQQQARAAHVKLQTLVPSIGAPPAQLEKTGKAVGKVEFWLSWKGRVVARLRKAFGRIFIKLAQGFHAIKLKFAELFKRQTDPTSKVGDAWWSRVIKVCWKIVRWALPRLLVQVINTLWDALARGVAAKIKEYIPIDDVEGELHDKAAALAKQLGLDNLDDVDNDTLVDAVVAKVATAIGFDDEIKKLEELADIANTLADLGTLVSWAKWIIRIIAAGSQCVWPPVLGCLKILIVPLVEWAALKLFDEIAEECWFQKVVATYVQRIDLLRYFGRRIGVALIDKIKAASPEIGDLFDVREVDDVRMDNYSCDASGDKHTPSPDQLKLADFATAMGEEGLRALIELDERLTDPNAAPDPDSTSRLRKEIENPPTGPDGPPQPGTSGPKVGGEDEVERPRGRRKEAPDGKPTPSPQEKPTNGPDGVPTPGKTGDPGDGEPTAPTAPDPDATTGPKGPDGAPTPGKTGPDLDLPHPEPQPGDNEGTDQPGGKEKVSPKGKKQKAGPGAGGTQRGHSEDMRGRARKMLGRLRKLRDELEKQIRSKSAPKTGGAPKQPEPGTGTKQETQKKEDQQDAGSSRQRTQGQKSQAGEGQQGEPQEAQPQPQPEPQPEPQPAPQPAQPEPQPEPAQADPDAEAKAARTQALIDLIDALIELLERVERGELDEPAEVEEAIAILVENAAKGVTLDPNATKIIYVFQFLGRRVSEVVTERTPPDPDADPSADADPVSGTPDDGDGDGDGKGKKPPDSEPPSGIDDLEGDPIDGEGPPIDAAPEAEPGDPTPPPPKPGRKRTPTPGGADPKSKPAQELTPEFLFDPIWTRGVLTGYHVTPVDRGALRLDGDRILNRKPSVVAYVTVGDGGEVTLVSGVLIDYLADLVRELDPPDAWSGDGAPTFKLNFYRAQGARNDEP